MSARWARTASLMAAGALAALAWGAPAAHAQRHAPQAHKIDLLRPLYANSMDIAEGKSVAQHFCADCHGPAGISTIPGVPDLAGQRAAYLYSEMRAYLSGARGDDTMNGAITYLSADAMSNVAAYYGSLPPAAPAPAAKKGELGAVEAGKAAAATCGGCHGATGITATAGVPSLVGQEPKYLVTALGEYKDGSRKNDTMKAMAAPLDSVTMSNIALFYALEKPAKAPTPAPGDAAAGQTASAPCAACHGANGISGNPATPSLAGQDAQYLADALHGYKSGARENTTMKALAASLDDATIKNLAAYYAGLQPQQPNVRKPLSTAEWVERCDRCHGPGGNSADPLMPSLASQRAAYLEKVLNAYRAGKRNSPVMSAMMDGMSENDVRNLAQFYASQKAHAVVYVPVPAR
ncbi:MAG TPA: c-type cytochrome [Acetobacteraceae bacterium]|nr:c-type cytochrome [Acetobacteraceae bacterium]